jgi:hypothetical protein
MKGIEEKLLKSGDQELDQKYSKTTKMKNIAAQHRRWINTKARHNWYKSRVYSQSTEVTVILPSFDWKLKLAHFYSSKCEMKLGSGKEPHPL